MTKVSLNNHIQTKNIYNLDLIALVSIATWNIRFFQQIKKYKKENMLLLGKIDSILWQTMYVSVFIYVAFNKNNKKKQQQQ